MVHDIANIRERELTLARRIGGKTRQGMQDDPEVAQLRAELAIARVEKRIAEAIDSAPPLPAEVESRLVQIIRSAGRREVA